MRLGKHISELLFVHEKVILPGFGCFSTRYIPASFSREKGVVEPPAKCADYSPEPSGGETPLLHYMAQQESKSIGETEAFISKVVAEVHRNLQSGKKVELEQLGVFHMDATGAYHFEPDRQINFLDDSAGLGEIKTPEQAPSVEAPAYAIPKSSRDKDDGPGSEDTSKSTHIVDTKSENDTQTQNYEEMTEEKRSGNLPPAFKWVAYTIVPLIVILIILFLNMEFFFGQGGLFRRSDKPVVETPSPVVQDPAKDVPALHKEEEPDKLAVREEEKTPSLRRDPSRPEPGRPVYYLLVGSFRNEEFASSLVNKLQGSGAHMAAILETTPAGFHRVSYGFYYDLEEAKAQKENLTGEFRDIAWILHR